MAANAAAVKYAKSATYGSAAYDLNRVRGYAAPQETPYYDIPYEQPYEQPKERAVPKTRTTAEKKVVGGISVFSVIGFVAAAVLVVVLLLSYVQLAEISGEKTALENTISQLETEQSKLRVEYESVFNLSEVEKYATTVLGMSKLTPENTTSLDANREDRAEILKADDAKDEGILATASRFFASLMEYFQ